MRIYYSLILIIPALILGCGKPNNQPTPEGKTVQKPLVVTTTTIIADLARQLCGTRMEVISIMKPGEDPHIYDPRPDDARLIARAKVVLTNGLHLEGTLHDIIENNLPVGAVSKELGEDDRILRIESQQYKGAPDPHVWFSVPYFKIFAARALEALLQADPDGASYYRDNAQTYQLALDSLDHFIRQAVNQIPAERRVLVTAHDAFNYFSREYGIQVLAITGISTEQEPRPQDVENLISLVQTHRVPAVFIEASVSPSLNNLVRKVSSKTGAAIGGTLYSDSLDEIGQPAGTYIGMFKHNVETIAQALRRK